jgi:LmbE family N-acetylglucosaminyl deacetylase
LGTLVTFHAHPDDEAIATGGTMAKAAAAGHRVVLVTATRGELGTAAKGVLATGEHLAERREAELAEAARILGVARVQVLGYRDSGMMGQPSNGAAGCFWQARLEEAAARLAGILVEEGANALTIYDSHGHYGHPDHIQVHRVGVRAAELASRQLGYLEVYEATLNRHRLLAVMQAVAEAGLAPIPELEAATETIGLPESEITTAVDVGPYLHQKRAAMAAHASQITAESFFLAMPPELFRFAFGTEWYRHRAAARGAALETEIFFGSKPGSGPQRSLAG